ncbi:hypothetical protein CEXT_702071 [Caerostris extrusa]|uniref:Uncharacterized protein n=1 Tax=Caerostris extrusa TaxID=172846 RepID=A0AAV4Y283_CAEEX|nr:hypothetical protein CEXT_702071 [Caerostris extrusa]
MGSQLILLYVFRIWRPYLVAWFKSASKLFSLTERISDVSEKERFSVSFLCACVQLLQCGNIHRILVLCSVSYSCGFSIGVNFLCRRPDPWEIEIVLLIAAPNLLTQSSHGEAPAARLQR